MELDNEKLQNSSLKIDTIWSEVDESILVKEEIVSDMEPDCASSSQETSINCHIPNSDSQENNEKNCNGYTNINLLPAWPSEKKKIKSKPQKNGDMEKIISHKLICLHDTKNFKVVKRRLRCGDCRSLVCPECCKVMVPNLQSHFLGSGIGGFGATFVCKLCGIIFHSLCALQAHIRIHTMDTPYVCPDCGLIYNNIYFLILHLLNKCYHVYKVVRYKCKHCTGAYFSPETFVKHIQETHIHSVFRCLYCSSLFNNNDEFTYHMENLHQKQKVQYLNYFRCSLCSNMVIPRFMYQRHISQHRENSEFYEVDYQCLCGEIYSLIGAFRSHFMYCNQKGVLPPRWSFLQKKLRTQDVLHHEIFQNRDRAVQLSPTCSDVEYNNLTLVKPTEQVITNDVVETKKPVCEKSSEELLVCNNFKSLNSASSIEDKARDYENECHLEANEGETLITDTEHCLLDAHKEFGDLESSNAEVVQRRNNGNTVQIDGDMYNSYEHIPCDHLGYVIKAQTSEPQKKSIQAEISGEESLSSKNYKIITQLDERTGIMSTKAVHIEELENDDDLNIIEDDLQNFESLSSTTIEKVHSNDKVKFKMNNSLSCPFCIILFPKHNLTFQQFRLHLEAYHPNAALNIIVNKEEKADEKTEATKQSAEINNKVEDFECSNLSTDLLTVPNSNPNNCEQVSSYHEENHNLNQTSVSENSETQANEPDKTSMCDEEDLSGGASKLGKTPNEEVNTSQKPTDDQSDKNQSQESEEYAMDTMSTHVESSYDFREPFHKDEKAECTSFENDHEANADEKKIDNDYPEESCEEIYEEQRKEEIPQNGESKTKKNPSDAEYEAETSKDSNWSAILVKDSKNISPKQEEKEKYRRESEVWSEFYKSLMFAEKLKKKKKASAEDESKKKSVVSDYSSKRVVKKPKRYRESSESDSNDYSDSDSEFLLRDDGLNKIYRVENDDAEDQSNKKQLLLNKLENFDVKFVDYLFDVVTKKEKMFELYKKHSTLRANRYNDDLRSYRKKVLNGIKQRGRPLKMLRYHEILKSKESNQPKKGTELSPESKSNERRRGRPRKYNDAARLKERRRSDKEVDFIEKNFEREESDYSPSKRKRKLSSKLQYYRKMSDDKEDFSSGQVISSKLPDSGKKFSCAVCKEVFPGHAELREHIVVHRMEENTYQCLECGECFVVRPSLEKHLHAFHKIKNTDKYITENECCNIKKEGVEPENEPLKENQCKVCKDQFERPIDLAKHFRIHGMAFLKEFKREGKTVDKKSI